MRNQGKSLVQFIYISYMLDHYPNLIVYVANKSNKMRYDTKYHSRIKVLHNLRGNYNEHTIYLL